MSATHDIFTVNASEITDISITESDASDIVSKANAHAVVTNSRKKESKPREQKDQKKRSIYNDKKSKRGFPVMLFVIFIMVCVIGYVAWTTYRSSKKKAYARF